MESVTEGGVTDSSAGGAAFRRTASDESSAELATLLYFYLHCSHISQHSLHCVMLLINGVATMHPRSCHCCSRTAASVSPSPDYGCLHGVPSSAAAAVFRRPAASSSAIPQIHKRGAACPQGCMNSPFLIRPFATTALVSLLRMAGGLATVRQDPGLAAISRRLQCTLPSTRCTLYTVALLSLTTLLHTCL